MDLDLFLAGMENKETWASAWLATNLRGDPAFRAAFLETLKVNPPLDADGEWSVDVETSLGGGACDVTLIGTTAFIFIENKVSNSAKRDLQLEQYYGGVVESPDYERLRAIAVFVGPEGSLGANEVAALKAGSAFAARVRAGHADDAVSIGWRTEVSQAIAETAEPAQAWFLHNGYSAILRHIEAVQRGRPFDQQRDRLRGLMRRVANGVGTAHRASGRGLPAEFSRWPTRRQEALYTPGQRITVWLVVRYEESDDEAATVGRVYEDDTVNVIVTVAINPSTKIGRRDAALMQWWGRLLAEGQLKVDGIEEPLRRRGEVAFELVLPFRGLESELERHLTAWGIAALRLAEHAPAAPG